MKKFIFLFASIIVASSSSCSDDSRGSQKFVSDPESGWVQFFDGTTQGYVFDPSAVYTIPVKLVAPVNTSGLEVTFTITDVVGSTAGLFDYSPVVNFVPNSITGGEIVLNVIATELNQNIEFDLTLTGTSRSNVQIGLGDNEKPIVKRIKICSTNIASSYVGSSTRVGGGTFTPWTPVLTPVVGEINKFQLVSCWGSGFVPFLTGNPATSTFTYPGFLTINADFSVTVVGINGPTTPNRYPGGSGTFDPCTKVINYRLNQGLFTNPFQVDVVLTPLSN